MQQLQRLAGRGRGRLVDQVRIQTPFVHVRRRIRGAVSRAAERHATTPLRRTLIDRLPVQGAFQCGAGHGEEEKMRKKQSRLLLSTAIGEFVSGGRFDVQQQQL